MATHASKRSGSRWPWIAMLVGLMVVLGLLGFLTAREPTFEGRGYRYWADRALRGRLPTAEKEQAEADLRRAMHHMASRGEQWVLRDLDAPSDAHWWVRSLDWIRRTTGWKVPFETQQYRIQRGCFVAGVTPARSPKVIQALTNALTHANLSIQSVAAVALGTCTNAPDMAVPALLGFVRRHRASLICCDGVQALTAYPVPASGAPDMEALLADPEQHSFIKRPAVVVLRHADPTRAAVMLEQMLDWLEPGAKESTARETLRTLSAFGPLAEAARPALDQVIQGTNTYLAGIARKTIAEMESERVNAR